jgi:hypothetical protein
MISVRVREHVRVDVDVGMGRWYTVLYLWPSVLGQWPINDDEIGSANTRQRVGGASTPLSCGSLFVQTHAYCLGR